MACNLKHLFLVNTEQAPRRSFPIPFALVLSHERLHLSAVQLCELIAVMNVVGDECCALEIVEGSEGGGTLIKKR